MQESIANPRILPESNGASCHGGPNVDTSGLPLIAIVGSPNVGKSVLFNTLTGAYVTVSNYPGTTVEVSRGKGRLAGQPVGVVDTPGMYRLVPVTEEERVARDILLQERPAVTLHVVDAKNLERMLPMTLQLIEAGQPVILVCNLMDEAERLGVKINTTALEQVLGIQVVATALTTGRGADRLKEVVLSSLNRNGHSAAGCANCESKPAQVAVVQYPPAIEDALQQIETQMYGSYQLTHRSIALLLLQNDAGVAALVAAQEGAQYADVQATVKAAQGRFSQPLSLVIARYQREAASRILQKVLTQPVRRVSRFAEKVSEATMNPLTGIPLLLLSMYLLYQFVGVFGAQTLVDFFENSLFGAYVNPWINGLLATYVPWPAIRDLIGNQYGVIPLGVRYAIAIILPIVGTFFLAFSVIEDSGYLPRLAMLIDRVFKKIGLNGRAVIPMVLGVGCDTMATIVTRTLETRRERVLSTILLSLAIPCSAQLGVMLGMLSGRNDLLLIWAAIMTGIFLLVGLVTARLMPGERPTFYMELPPLRLPSPKNVFVKTYTRMEWYFREVFPLFIIASLVIWLGRLTGLFDLAISALEPLVRWLGLPDQTAVAFLFGFFRRDYGAAGLYDLRNTMTGVQILVSTVTMTLFVPCVAQFSVTVKERGWKTALAIFVFIFPFAFLVGGLLNWLLMVLGVKL
ncbi:MAG TPA: ferrous iron transport protein B [Bellilinea sp.]|nr:ferrous iron transport protein B [Bellilinea sp.]